MNERDIERAERMKEILLKQVELLQEESVKLIKDIDALDVRAGFTYYSAAIAKLATAYHLFCQ